MSKHHHALTSLAARVAALEARAPVTAPPPLEHRCAFMPPGFKVVKVGVGDWRLSDTALWSPRFNFCPYCGVQLCAPELP